MTVVLLVRQPGQRELESLELVRKQEYPGRVFIHVIDSSPNAYEPPNRHMAAASDQWRSIPPSDFHHGRTRNLAVESVETEIVVFLSSDAHPVGPQWLTALVEPVASGAAEVSYGRQRSPDPDPEREAAYGFLYPDEAQIKSKASIREMGVRALHFSDVHSAYRTDVLREVPFPENIAIFQDAVIPKLLFDAGKRIAYVPDAEVLHAHPLTLRSMWHRFRGLGEVWQRAGLFDEIANEKGRVGFFKEGLKAVSHMVPRGSSPRQVARSLATGVVKAVAVAEGRRDAKRRPPLSLEWDERSGSRAVRR